MDIETSSVTRRLRKLVRRLRVLILIEPSPGMDMDISASRIGADMDIDMDSTTSAELAATAKKTATVDSGSMIVIGLKMLYCRDEGKQVKVEIISNYLCV